MTTDPLAQAAMVAYCGWDPTLVVTDQQILLDGDGTSLLFLPSLYVTGVSAVTVTLPDGSTYDAQIGPGLDVTWGENGVVTWHAMSPVTVWPSGQQNIAITYSGGYATVPADLAAALASLSKRTPSMSGATSVKIGTASITYASQNAAGHFGSQSIAAGGLLLVEQMVFDRYRIMKAA